MGRCGEDDFFDMTIGSCAHCDLICHTRQGNEDLDKCEAYCKGFLSKHPEIMDHINRNHPIKTALQLQQYPITQNNPLLSTTTTGTSEQLSDLTVVAVISVILVLLFLGVLQFIQLVMVTRKKLENRGAEESNVNIVNGISDGSDGTDMHGTHDHSDSTEKCDSDVKNHHPSGNSECSSSSRTALLQNLVDKQPAEHQERIFERQLSTISSRSDISELVVIETDSSELYPCPSSLAYHSTAITVVISYNP